MFLRFFEELGFFGARQTILWVILLQMHKVSALYDPWGSCYDQLLSVAGGEAAAAKPLGGVWGGREPPPAIPDYPFC